MLLELSKSQEEYALRSVRDAYQKRLRRRRSSELSLLQREIMSHVLRSIASSREKLDPIEFDSLYQVGRAAALAWWWHRNIFCQGSGESKLRREENLEKGELKGKKKKSYRKNNNNIKKKETRHEPKTDIDPSTCSDGKLQFSTPAIVEVSKNANEYNPNIPLGNHRPKEKVRGKRNHQPLPWKKLKISKGNFKEDDSFPSEVIISRILKAKEKPISEGGERKNVDVSNHATTNSKIIKQSAETVPKFHKSGKNKVLPKQKTCKVATLEDAVDDTRRLRLPISEGGERKNVDVSNHTTTNSKIIKQSAETVPMFHKSGKNNVLPKQKTCKVATLEDAVDDTRRLRLSPIENEYTSSSAQTRKKSPTYRFRNVDSGTETCESPQDEPNSTPQQSQVPKISQDKIPSSSKSTTLSRTTEEAVTTESSLVTSCAHAFNTQPERAIIKILWVEIHSILESMPEDMKEKVLSAFPSLKNEENLNVGVDGMNCIFETMTPDMQKSVLCSALPFLKRRENESGQVNTILETVVESVQDTPVNLTEELIPKDAQSTFQSFMNQDVEVNYDEIIPESTIASSSSMKGAENRDAEVSNSVSNTSCTLLPETNSEDGQKTTKCQLGNEPQQESDDYIVKIVPTRTDTQINESAAYLSSPTEESSESKEEGMAKSKDIKNNQEEDMMKNICMVIDDEQMEIELVFH